MAVAQLQGENGRIAGDEGGMRRGYQQYRLCPYGDRLLVHVLVQVSLIVSVFGDGESCRDD